MIVLALTIPPSSSSATASSTGITLTRMSSPSPASPCRPPTPSLSTRPQNRRTVSVLAPGLVRNDAMGTRSVTVQPASSRASRRAISSGVSPGSMIPATHSRSQGSRPAAHAPGRNCSMRTTRSRAGSTGSTAATLPRSRISRVSTGPTPPANCRWRKR